MPYPAEYEGKPQLGMPFSARRQELDLMRFIAIRNMAYIHYKNPSADPNQPPMPLLTYNETIAMDRDEVRRRVLGFELQNGLIAPDGTENEYFAAQPQQAQQGAPMSAPPPNYQPPPAQQYQQPPAQQYAPPAGPPPAASPQQAAAAAQPPPAQYQPGPPAQQYQPGPPQPPQPQYAPPPQQPQQPQQAAPQGPPPPQGPPADQQGAPPAPRGRKRAQPGGAAVAPPPGAPPPVPQQQYQTPVAQMPPPPQPPQQYQPGPPQAVAQAPAVTYQPGPPAAGFQNGAAAVGHAPAFDPGPIAQSIDRMGAGLSATSKDVETLKGQVAGLQQLLLCNLQVMQWMVGQNSVLADWLKSTGLDVVQANVQQFHQFLASRLPR
jgi:hypothetical protein